MKIPFSAALALGLTVAVSSLAAAETKAQKAAKKKPSTLPPTSKMIVIPPVDPAAKSDAPQKLISSEMSGEDLQFFTTTVEAGRFQAYLVELLKTKAQSEQIKSLAGALSDTQEQENKQIARLAAAKGWPVSTEPAAAQKALGEELEKQDGSNFDKAVMDRMIAATQESVGAYEGAAHSDDADIKHFSEQMLPLAQGKLRLVERMTGAGKSAAQLFRTGAPPKPATPAATPKAGSGQVPPAIIPSKVKPGAASPAASKPAAVSTPAPAAVATPAAATPPAGPRPIPPPITN